MRSGLNSFISIAIGIGIVVLELDVSDRVSGTPLRLPGNSFRVITYTDENSPAARPRVKVQLQTDLPK